MPYTKKKRPYKKEYQQQKARGEHADRMERQRARRKIDKTGVDRNKNGKADKREGKDVSHNKALSKGCLLYTSPSPRDISGSRMPSSA